MFADLSSVINIRDSCLDVDHPDGVVNALASGPVGGTVGTRLKLSGDLLLETGLFYVFATPEVYWF